MPPNHVGPKLLNRRGDDGSSPYYRVALVFQQQIDGHNIHAAFRFDRQNTLAVASGFFLNAEHLGNRGAGDIPVQNAGVIALALHRHSQHGGNQAFSNASLPADYADHFLHVAARVGLFHHAPGRRPLAAVLAAGFAVVRTRLAQISAPPFIKLDAVEKSLRSFSSRRRFLFSAAFYLSIVSAACQIFMPTGLI